MPTIFTILNVVKVPRRQHLPPTHDQRVAKFENTKDRFGYPLAKFKVVGLSIFVLCHPPPKPMTWRPTCDLFTRHMANPMKFSSQPSSFPSLLNVKFAREDSFRTTRFDALWCLVCTGGRFHTPRKQVHYINKLMIYSSMRASIRIEVEYSQLQFKELLSGRGKENAMCHFEIGWHPRKFHNVEST